MQLVLVVLFLAICGINLVALRRSGWVGAHNLFIFFNGIMGVGILYNLDYSNSVDLAHIAVIFITAVMYLVGSVYFAGVYELRSVWATFTARTEIVADPRDFSFAVVLYCVSLTVAIVYFYLVGYNVLVNIAISGLGNVDATELRMASYSGDDYFAPGYFNQFKNVLLPWAFIAITAMLVFIRRRSIGTTFGIALLAAPVIVCLLGTGQRAYLVFFLITFFIGLVLFTRDRIKVRTRLKVLAYSMAGFFLFSLMSLALGRSEDSSVGAALNSFFSRIFYSQQMGDVVGFRYIYGLPVQMGADWITDFLGVLPSRRGSELAHIVHGILFGSERGTAPVSIWTSVFFNWGWPGIVLFPLLLGMLYPLLTRTMLHRNVIRAPELVTFAFLNFYLASWVASGPMQLVNNGLITVCLVLIVYRGWRAITQEVRALAR